MPRFIETIKLLDGEFYNLERHQQRVEGTFERYFPYSKIVNLIDRLREVEIPKTGLFKCRVVYETDIHKVEVEPYQIKAVTSLKIVRSESVGYDYKFENRDELLQLYKLRGDADDIVIVKNGLVTDSSYANLIFKKGSEWFTPSTPLLRGTMRHRLIEDKKVGEQIISLNDIRKFEKIKLVNSMVGFDGPEVDIKNVIF